MQIHSERNETAKTIMCVPSILRMFPSVKPAESQGVNSIESQQTFQQSFYHYCTIKTLLKSQLKSMLKSLLRFN